MRFLYWLSRCQWLLAVCCYITMNKGRRKKRTHPHTHTYTVIQTSIFIFISILHFVFGASPSSPIKHHENENVFFVCAAFSVHLFSITISPFVLVCHRLFPIFYGLCLLSRSMELSLASNAPHTHTTFIIQFLHHIFRPVILLFCLQFFEYLIEIANVYKHIHSHFIDPITKIKYQISTKTKKIKVPFYCQIIHNLLSNRNWSNGFSLSHFKMERYKKKVLSKIMIHTI